MQTSDLTMAQRIAQAAIVLEKKRSGLVPKSVSVVHSDATLVVTLHGVLSPAELALAKTASGAAQLQEYHRKLFASDDDALRSEIKRITGMDVRQAVAEVDPATGLVVAVFTSGTIVQVFLLADAISEETWSSPEGGQP